MTDIVFGGATTPPATVNATERNAAPERKSIFRRFYDRLIESRLAHARQEMARYGHLAPQEIRAAASFSRASDRDASQT